MSHQPESRRTPAVLVTGATGDIGGRLVPLLEAVVYLGGLATGEETLSKHLRSRIETGQVLGAVVHQTAVFEPVGLSGLLYWYVLFPVHTLIFWGLLRAIARRALSRS